jgi:hypothetical protein
MIACVLLFGVVGIAFADPTGNQGQPSQTCQDLAAATGMPVTPGNAGNPNNTGSPFSPNGHAGTVYAGTQPQNSNNSKSVSQYDVACFQHSQHQ